MFNIGLAEIPNKLKIYPDESYLEIRIHATLSIIAEKDIPMNVILKSGKK
jgi:hypothetical protein